MKNKSNQLNLPTENWVDEKTKEVAVNIKENSSKLTAESECNSVIPDNYPPESEEWIKEFIESKIGQRLTPSERQWIILHFRNLLSSHIEKVKREMVEKNKLEIEKCNKYIKELETIINTIK